MLHTSAPEGAMSVQAPRRKLIWAGCFGNFLEFYNFLAFAFFAPMIGASFFPGHDDMARLVSAMLTFGAGFLARPLGAFLFGLYARKHGNAQTLTVTMMVMAAGSLLIALTPSHATIGGAAPLLVLLGRLAQGFAEGGEVGPATDFLYNLANGRRAGALGGLQYTTQILASLAAVLIGAALAAFLSQTQLYTWGWRMPFLAGLLIVPFGFWLRRNAVHTHTRSAPSPQATAQLDWVNVTLIFLTITTGTIVTYIRTFGVSYAIAALHLSPLTSMVGSACGMALALGTIALCFEASIRTNPLRILLLTGGASMLLVYPAYLLATRYPGLETQISLSTVQFVLTGVGALPMYAILLHALPNHARAGVFGVVYTLAVSIFGGATTPCLAWLLRRTHDPMIPAYVSLAVFPLYTLFPILLGLRTGLIPKRFRQAARPAQSSAP